MKHITLVIATLLIGCGFSNIRQDRFSENWYTCSKDGLYIELLIKANSFKYSASNGLITKYCNFKINYDTLIFSEPNLFEDSIIIKKAMITFISDDQLIMDFITSNEHWTFNKLKEKIFDIDNNEQLLIGTEKRAKKYTCLDTRTKDEKTKDSLDKQIDFKF